MKQGRRRREPGKYGGDSPSGQWRLQEHYTLKSDNPETRIALGSRMTPRSGNPGEGKGGENLRGSAGSYQEPSAHLAGYRYSRIHRLASPGNPAEAGSDGGRPGQFLDREPEQREGGGRRAPLEEF